MSKLSYCYKQELLHLSLEALKKLVFSESCNIVPFYNQNYWFRDLIVWSTVLISIMM